MCFFMWQREDSQWGSHHVCSTINPSWFKFTQFYYTEIRSEKSKPEKVSFSKLFFPRQKSGDRYQIGQWVPPVITHR